MAIEIEHRYLVRDVDVEFLARMSTEIVTTRQFYLADTGGWCQRVRSQHWKSGRKRFTMTMKRPHPTIPNASTELETDIDYNFFVDCQANSIDRAITKTRHLIEYETDNDFRWWEVDVFHGKNEGLIIAELELKTPDEKYDVPVWATEDITGQRQYSNYSLAETDWEWMKETNWDWSK